jgi:hypothetical protein
VNGKPPAVKLFKAPDNIRRHRGGHVAFL